LPWCIFGLTAAAAATPAITNINASHHIAPALLQAQLATQPACLHSDGLLGLKLLLHCLDVLLRDGGVLSQDGPELITSQRLLLQQLLSDPVNGLPVAAKDNKKITAQAGGSTG
jgi:hypothetical protein